MNILILGGGGREHALAWAVLQNPKCDRLIVAPGNAGIAQIAECSNIDILDNASLVAFCEENSISFIIVGPEAPLENGAVDNLTDAGFLAFGPRQAAAQLESSKTFTKEVCDACGAPTATWARFTNAPAAHAYIDAQGAPIVVKADGLAAGKGVVVAMTEAEARDAIDSILGGAFGAAGASVVIEEFMDGEEASLFVLCDGTDTCVIGTAQDHKRIGEGDTGPNTGGMGAYSPAPVLTDEIVQQTMDQIITPTVSEMARRGTSFTGVLYAGLMIKDGLARLVEYNVRFGDPECQALMIRLGGQVLDLLLACARGTLADVSVNWAPDHAMTVVLAATGYPGSYAKGTVIGGLDTLPNDAFHMMFHAGTSEADGQITTNGGRVLNATGRGATLAEARDRAYALAEAVDWPDGVYRRDIGWRALS